MEVNPYESLAAELSNLGVREPVGALEDLILMMKHCSLLYSKVPDSPIYREASYLLHQSLGKVELQHFNLSEYEGPLRSQRNIVFEILSSDAMALGILFIPKENYIPFHNHPGGMMVKSKVLAGLMYYRSLTVHNLEEEEELNSMLDIEEVSNPTIPALVHSDGYLHPGRIVEVDPLEGNVHYLYAIEDSFILDVLIPNYNEDRRISVFMEVQDERVAEELRVQHGYKTKVRTINYCFKDTLHF
jgi:hypothetical protein